MRTPATPNNPSLDVTNLDLLGLGDGQVGYIRMLEKDELPDLPEDIILEKAYGVFSAKGEALALCDSVNAALLFSADHELQMVSLH